MLQELSKLPSPIRVIITGMGAMGKGLFYQTEITPGFHCVAISDIDMDKALDVAVWLKRPYRIVHSTSDAMDAIRTGNLAVTDNSSIIVECVDVDVLIESTSTVVEAGKYCETAIEKGMHISMMNAEADLAFGPYLMDLARKNGVVYSSCDGDQHGVIKQLHDEMVLWGFKPVMAGNIKGFLDRYSNPVKIIPEADKRKLDYKMAAAYTDGTKLNIEMALVSNALNMKTIVPGMFGPVAREVKEVLSLYDFEKLWDGQTPFVDYILGAEPGGGVFTVGYSENDYQRFMMNYYKMGPGPFFLFYRPYHLCHVESLKWIARAHLHGESLLQPDFGFRTDVITYAKKDLKKGESIDGIGGFCCYGMIENMGENSLRGLPICLSEGKKLLRDIRKDEKIGLNDVTWENTDHGMEMYFKAFKGGEIELV
ncbi:MAG: hypothetical protein R6W71_07895 [Bacteroidales bacterium]